MSDHAYIPLTAHATRACKAQFELHANTYAVMDEQFSRVPLEVWKSDLPVGRIEKLYLHWSAGDYETVYPAYHFCIGLNSLSKPFVAQTSDLRLNMRDVRTDPDRPYTAHTRGRNSYAAGISIMCMQDAEPWDFGAYPLTESLIDALAYVAGRLASHYRIPVSADTIMSHAEAAVSDGYFGTAPEQRWDIARLVPCEVALREADAVKVGDELRQRIAAHGINGTPNSSL